MEKRIFYSWQNTTDSKINRYFIEKCLKNSIKSLNSKNHQYKFILDQATRNLPGSPNIVDAIFNKISHSHIFVADITSAFSNDDKKAPNPNVLVELGYAINILGWENIICLCNTSFGEVTHSPFDINQNRITPYKLKSNIKKEYSESASKLTNTLKFAFDLITENQSKQDVVTQLFKVQLDQLIIDIAIHLNMLFGITDMITSLDIVSKLIKIYQDGNLKINLIQSGIQKFDIFFKKTGLHLDEISRHPLLVLHRDVEKITSIIKLKISVEKLYYYLVPTIKSNPPQREVVNDEIINLSFIVDDIFKELINVIVIWGNYLLQDPSKIYFDSKNSFEK